MLSFLLSQSIVQNLEGWAGTLSQVDRLKAQQMSAIATNLGLTLLLTRLPTQTVPRCEYRLISS
jgi:hypothetical protein